MTPTPSQLQLIVNAPPPVTVNAPDTTALVAQYTNEILPIAAFRVTDNTSYAEANQHWTRAKGFSDQVAALFAGPKKLAHQAHKAITTLEAQLIAPAKQIADHMGGEILRYQQEQERIRRAAEAEAQRQRDIEAKRERGAEAQRLEAERQAQLAELAERADDLAPWEEEDALAIIAATHTPQPVEVMPVAPIRLPSMVPTVAGGPNVALKPWSAEVFDRDALFEAAYHNKALRQYWEPVQTALNVKARELGPDTEKTLPGVRGVREQTLRRS